MKVALYILGIGLWTALLYFLAAPWLAGLWCLILLAVALLVYAELHRVEVKEPTPEQLGQVLDLEEEWKAHGSPPLDRHYEAVGERRAA